MNDLLCQTSPRMQMHNFNSGPSILPQEVLQQAAEAIYNFNDSGLSILEIGHRTTLFKQVLDEARTSVKQLMELDDDYEVLFLHGGATTQFMQIPMNLLDDGETAAYCDNGIWGRKAINEAGIFGNALVVASSQDRNHSYIPKDFTVPADCKYLHITSNNTVEGTQWHSFPQTSAPLVVDMSSDIFHRPLNFRAFGLIYAGAQKNMGAAGVNVVVIRKDLLRDIKRPIPAIMDYRIHIKENSLLNTPPVFAIYVSMLTLRWIIKEGGLTEMEKRAKQRAGLFYDTLDRLPLFRPLVAKEDRSLMNATFTIEDKALEDAFLLECDKNGMVGVKGHRSVGGLRVSMYNALPLSSVQAICDLMHDFQQKKG